MVKSRYWSVVMYPEHFPYDWKNKIEDILQVPFAYCVHDKDLVKEVEEERKEHVHILLAFGNTTTLNSVHQLLCELYVDSCTLMKASVKRCMNVQNMYNYLIHDTDKARKEGKYQYPKSERILCNDFDIGKYVSKSLEEKTEMAQELADFLISESITNFADFYLSVCNNYDSSYFEIIKNYSGLYDRLCKGVYLKQQENKKVY